MITVEANAPVRSIRADYEKIKGLKDKSWKVCVGACHAALNLREDWCQQLELIHQECGFEYVRFHGLLDDDMEVYSEDAQGGPLYDWKKVDALYDSILKVGMRPFVELGFMPEALASGPQTIFFYKGNVTPPKSYEKWGALVEALVRHFEERYGRAEVKQWYFEVWNEPNLKDFWAGSMEDYFKLYEVSAKAIKGVCADYKVGGPGTAGCGWVKETIDFSLASGTDIDFISTHTYGTSGHLDEYGQHQNWLVPDIDCVAKSLVETREIVRQTPLPDLPIHITEWSTSYSPRDASHDSYIAAAYILNTIKKSEGTVSSLSYWTFTDIFEEPGLPEEELHGGFGLLTISALKKPSFFAYHYMNRLGATELESTDASSWVCRSEKGVQVLLWDAVYLPQDQKTEPSHVFFKKDLKAKASSTAQVELNHIPAGTYRLSVRKVGYEANDLFDAYRKMGSPKTPDAGQLTALKEATLDKAVMEKMVEVGADGSFKTELPLRQNDVYLIELEKWRS